MNSARIALLLLCFLMTVGSGKAGFQAKFKILRVSDGVLTYEDVARTPDLEYPRGNVAILNKLKELWENYYQCLKVNENVERKPEIRRLQQGQYTELQCPLCARPFETYEKLQWKFKRLTPAGKGEDSFESLLLTPGMVLTHNKTLKIYNVADSMEGIYVCYREESVISVYILEVSVKDTLEKIANETSTEQVIEVKESPFRVYRAWSNWTECNACGRVGKKFKYGTCYVSITKKEHDPCEEDPKEQQRRQRQNKNVRPSTTQSEKVKKRTKSKQELLTPKRNRTGKGWGLEILEKFSTGIPCASRYLPDEISEKVKDFRPVKVLVEHCWETCEQNVIFVAFDSQGRVLETANNSAGIYSVFQGLPLVPPDVERRTISAEFGENLVIHCPGSSLTDTPVVWKIKNKTLFPDLIANSSEGRIRIDLLNRIQIKKLRLGDSQKYSCWHREQLVGTVRLIVEKNFSICLNHHVILILTLILLGILLLLARKIISGMDDE